MKIAILSESPADESALRVLVQAVLKGGASFSTSGLRARGWPNVIQILPAVLRHLHFNTDVDGLAVVVDSDDTPVHNAAHDEPGHFHPQCRLCQLRAVFRQTTKKLPPAHGRERVCRGVGVAVPAIEAWYLCGRENDADVTEEAWVKGLATGHAPYSRSQLKYRVYGTDRPNLPMEIRYAVEAAHRHAGNTRRLEYDFPGFASLAEDLRGWGPKPAQTY